MHRVLRRSAVVGLAASLMAAGAFAAAPPPPRLAGVLRVGNQRGGTHAVMEAAGVLKGVPYRIEWSLFPAASPLLEALGAGAVDAGEVGGAPFAFAYAAGAKIKAVQATRFTGSGKTSAIVARNGSPIRSPAQLKGARIATIRGSAGQELALKVLEKAGLKPSDVKFVYLSNGDAKAALATGAVDAWSTWGSYVGIAVEEGGARVVADATGTRRSPGFEVASVAAIRDKRAILADFLRRLALARRWAVRNKEAYAKVLARETGIPVSVARYTSDQAMVPVPIDAEVVGDQQDVFELYRRAGVIDRVPNLAGAYDPSFNVEITK